jgi:hypothetical protein
VVEAAAVLNPDGAPKAGAAVAVVVAGVPRDVPNAKPEDAVVAAGAPKAGAVDVGVPKAGAVDAGAPKAGAEVCAWLPPPNENPPKAGAGVEDAGAAGVDPNPRVEPAGAAPNAGVELAVAPNAGVVEAPNVVEPVLEPNAGAAVNYTNIRENIVLMEILNLHPNPIEQCFSNAGTCPGTGTCSPSHRDLKYF